MSDEFAGPALGKDDHEYLERIEDPERRAVAANYLRELQQGLRENRRQMAARGIVYASEDPAYQLEDFEKYRPGGLAVVHLGDVLNNRYKIVDKLGAGAFSTVWLAQDLRKTSYVALKIVTAEFSADSQEEDILRCLSETKTSASGCNDDLQLIPRLLDAFFFETANGRHRTLVSDAMRCDMIESLFEAGPNEFPLDTARAMAAQLILAVRALHARGIAHGDVGPKNVLFRIPSVDHLSVEQLHSKVFRNDPFPLERNDGNPVGEHGPKHVYDAIGWGLLCNDVKPKDAQIVLADYGESFMPGQGNGKRIKTPGFLRAPEDKFEPGLIGLPIDIWALAITIWMCFAGSGPYWPLKNSTEDQVVALGKLPTRWLDTWEKQGRRSVTESRARGLVADGNLKERVLRRINKHRKEADQELVPDDELTDLHALLQSMLVFEPSERATATQVADSAWMRNWGRPALGVMERAVTEADPDGDLVPQRLREGGSGEHI